MGARKRTTKQKRLEAAFSLLGTVVLVATFWEHEVRRENAKDITDSVQQAQAAALLRIDLNNVREKLDRMSRDVTEANPSAEEKGFALQTRLNIAEDERYSIWLESLSGLVRVLHDKGATDHLEELRQRLKDVEAKRDDIRGRTIERQEREIVAGMSGIPRMGPPSHEDQQLRSESQSLTVMDASHLFIEIRNFADDINTRANALADQSDKEYQKSKRWSYFLIPLGILLNLIGKLTGFGEVNSEE